MHSLDGRARACITIPSHGTQPSLDLVVLSSTIDNESFAQSLLLLVLFLLLPGSRRQAGSKENKNSERVVVGDPLPN